MTISQRRNQFNRMTNYVRSRFYPVKPVVSVVITCYNYGHFLANAIDSVMAQSWPSDSLLATRWKPIEIIVVDDGSTDDTRVVSARYPFVKYVYQPNQGPSAARNTGIEHSKGDFLIFLDADDWLYPTGVSTGFDLIAKYDGFAFVSGASDMVDPNGNVLSEITEQVAGGHFYRLLQGNYIGMNAAVIFRRDILKQCPFDASLRACEDYDVYLRITRTHTVLHHNHKVAAYRMHGHNVSANRSAMLRGALAVLDRWLPTLDDPSEQAACQQGQQNWRDYYEQIATQQRPEAMKRALKKYAPVALLRQLHRAGFYPGFTPPPGRVKLADLSSAKPFSTEFGYDRGGPVDRYYIETFLNRQAACIRGQVLEIGDNTYTHRYGGDRVTKSDVLHVRSGNPLATIVGDLSNAPHIPDNSFDCLIITQTLQLIYDVRATISTCERILRPGGSLLLTVPGISPIAHDQWNSTWFWSFTSLSVQRLLLDVFPPAGVDIGTHGNVLLASAFLYGMSASEFRPDQLDLFDPHYQLIITAKATKSCTPDSERGGIR